MMNRPPASKKATPFGLVPYIETASWETRVQVPTSWSISNLSNHEKAVGAVAAELFDEAVFPIEVGLHRARIDIGALIGTAVALRPIGLWQNLRRPYFERAAIAALEHVSFKAHLREPGRRHIGADAQVVGKKNARAAHRCGDVDLLDQLPARIMAKVFDVACGKFFGVANVEAIERAVALRLQRRCFLRA